MASQDKIFSKPIEQISKFRFDQKVVDVFDDMLTRSVPFYLENLKFFTEMAKAHYQNGARVYDLGASHGNLTFRLLESLKGRLGEVVAVDNSEAMVHALNSRKKESNALVVIQSSIEDCDFKEASLICLNLTLQFVNPEKRNEILKKIHQALLPGGVLLICEKIVSENTKLESTLQEFHYGFKKSQGYSNLEISQKREALEEVLIPDSFDGILKRLQDSGFSHSECFFRAFNFASFIAYK